MTAGVAVIFKKGLGKPCKSHCINSYLAYQETKDGAGVYSLLTKPKFFNKPSLTDYNLAFQKLTEDF